MATPTKPLLPPNYRNRKPRYWVTSLIVLLLAVAAMTAILVFSLRQNLGLVGEMNNASAQTAEFQNLIKNLSVKLSQLNADKEKLVAAGKILAMSPDANFVLRGNEACVDKFNITLNTAATAKVKNPGDKIYDLGYQASQDLESNGLGSVVVKVAATSTTLSDQYAPVFKTDKLLVGAIITTATEQDSQGCKVWVAEK